MARISAFAGIRYHAPDGRLDAVLAPPYDVISEPERARLAARSEHNAVHLELPVEEGGLDRYRAAARRWEAWRSGGVLVADPEPSLYVYRVGYHDDAGRPRQTGGVIGALELSRPEEGRVLPHERTTPRARADRLELLRACRANLSPIWALSPTEGLSELCQVPGPPDARGTDDHGVHHRVWRVSQPALLEALVATVGSAPVVIADGHHRYETALAYGDERRSAADGAPGPYDSVMAWVVEASEDQLTVGPIHRLLSGLPADLELVEALSGHFEVTATDGGRAAPADLPARMAEAGALGLVTPGGAWLLRPTPTTAAAAEHDLDSSRLDVALAGLPPHAVAFQHGAEEVLGAVGSGQAQAAVLLRPATVAQIAAVGRGGARMPPKTTFFAPKPATGLVFRDVAG